MSNSANWSAVTVSTSISSSFSIRWFSGRVTGCMRADDRRLLGAAQQRAQRQPAGDRIGVGVVVGEDEHAVGVAEVALVLLDALARERAVELGGQARLDQLGQGEPVDFGEIAARSSSARCVVVGTGAEQVDQHAAGVAHGVENPAQAALVRVLDDDGGAGQRGRRDVGVDAGAGRRR